jgi:hypothetical protein
MYIVNRLEPFGIENNRLRLRLFIPSLTYTLIIIFYKINSAMVQVYMYIKNNEEKTNSRRHKLMPLMRSR